MIPATRTVASESDGAGVPQSPDASRLAGNYLLLVGGELLAKLTLFFAFTHMGRVLGAERYGDLEFTLASMVFFTLPVDLGLGVYGAREIARNHARAPVLLREVARLRLLLVGASLACLAVFVLLVPKSAEVKQLLMVYGLSLLALPLHFQWYFQGHDRMGWVAGASIIRSAMFAGLVFLMLRPGSPLVVVGAVECASVAAVAVFCLSVAATRFKSRLAGPRTSMRASLAHLREAAPIGIVELTWAFLWYIATVLLGLLASGDSVGWFGASHRLVMALHTFVWMYFFNLLPSISRTRQAPRPALCGLLGPSIRLTVWGGVLAALVISMAAGDLLGLAYGAAFAPGGPLLATLVWIIPLALLSGHYRYTLIAYGLQRWHLYSTAVAAAVVVGLSLYWMPRFGALGAARALLTGCLVEFALVWLSVRRMVVAVGFARQCLAPAALAALLGLLVPLSAWNTVARAAFSALVYLSVAVLLERREIGRVARLARERWRLRSC